MTPNGKNDNKIMMILLKTVDFSNFIGYNKNRRFSDNTSIKQPRKRIDRLIPFSPLKKEGFFMKFNVAKLARAGVIAALYSVSALIVFPIASGAVQIRISEALTLLPLLFFDAVPALFVGCIVVNFITGCALPDVIFGSIITLLAALSTFAVGKIFRKKAAKIIVGGLFPVLLNAFFLPLVWKYCYAAEYVYYIQVSLLLLGQAVSVYAIGVPITLKLLRLKNSGLKALE